MQEVRGYIFGIYEAEGIFEVEQSSLRILMIDNCDNTSLLSKLYRAAALSFGTKPPEEIKEYVKKVVREFG